VITRDEVLGVSLGVAALIVAVLVFVRLLWTRPSVRWIYLAVVFEIIYGSVMVILNLTVAVDP